MEIKKKRILTQIQTQKKIISSSADIAFDRFLMCLYKK